MKPIENTRTKDLERAEMLLQQVKPNIEILYFDDATIAGLKEAMELFEKWEEDEQIAQTYSYWADYLGDIDDLENALDFAEKSLAIRLKYFKEAHKLVIESYDQISFFHTTMYNFELSHTYLEKALKLSLELYGEQHILTATCYSSLSALLSEEGNQQQALDYIWKSKKILDSLPTQHLFFLGNLYNSLCVTYHETGEFIQMKGYLEKVEAIYHQILPPYHKEWGRLFLGYFSFYDYIGDSKRAMVFIQKAIDVLEHHYANTLPTAHCYGLLCSLLYGNKSFDKVIRYAQKVFSIFSALGIDNHSLLYFTYENVGAAFTGKDNQTSALDCFEKGLQIALAIDGGEDGVNVGCSYQRLGKYYLLNNKLDKAESYLQKSWRILDQHGHPSPNVSIELLNNIAALYQEKGHFFKALQKIHQTFVLALEGYDNEDFYDYPSFNLHENPYKIKVKYQVLAIMLFEKSSFFFQYYLNEDKNPKNLLASFKGIQIGLKLANQIRESFYSEGSKLNTAYLIQTELENTVNVIFALYELFDEYEYLNSMFDAVEQSKAYLMLLNKKAETTTPVAGIPQEILQQEKELKTQLVLLEKNIQAKKYQNIEANRESLQQLQNNYFRLYNEFENLRLQLEINYPNYYRQKYNAQTVTIEALQESLQENQTVLNYFIGEEKIYLFTITSDEYEVFALEKPNHWKGLIQDYLQSIKLHQKANFHQLSFELYQVLLQEAMHHIIDPFADEDEQRQLFIIPHAELHYLPFETLIIQEADTSKSYQDLDYLLNHCQISYHYSATLLDLDLQKQSTAEQAPQEMSFTGFAPVYSSTSSTQQKALEVLQNEPTAAVNRSEAVRSDGTWMPLPHSKIEVENISQLFEKEGLKNQAFLHQTANKINLEEQIGKSRFVLIAAHGIVNDEYPELSGLVLASDRDTLISNECEENSPSFEKHGDIWNGNEQRDSEQTAVEDCILNMKEVAMIPMSADLVVLSSCESGIGELHKGEGMMAVNRGFLASGAKNVVSTLFKVNDRASSELTQLMFTHILKGENYVRALQKAKLELLMKEGMSPRTWSGFVLFGSGN